MCIGAFLIKRRARIIVMFRFDSTLRKKALSLYTLKCICLNNNASSPIATNGDYVYLITAHVFYVIEHCFIMC